ncbi:NUDIX hydrolase [Halalkalibacter alkalisediminis]|uniref:NUDIX domain-containing protein n=1 Tax=Halalkalibacter alkalisediminis TaxID=935616 RepID=A0ABV6NM81_9BACI|nr:NUDIX domain-containing protein [Halalkalibacter alkalisediminis]
MIKKVGAAIINNGRLLAVSKKESPDFFMLPGGKIEAGESEIDALRRELKEEISVELISYKHLGKYLTIVMDGKEKLELSVYETLYKGDPIPDNEIADIKWLPLDSEKSKFIGSGITDFTLPTLRKKYYVQ